MKTLIVYEEIPEVTKFFVVDGDRSDLNGKFANTFGWDDFPENIKAELVDPEQHFGACLEAPLKIDGEHIVVVCGFVL